MNPRDIAMEYLRCFCGGAVDGLAPLLAPNLSFTGPLHTFASAAEYLAALRRDPPEPCGYTVLSVTEDADSVALFYDYQKPGKPLQIAQLFNIKDQQIQEILLIFDGRAFG